MKKVLIKPHITEKTIGLTKANKYTFVVDRLARKEDIKAYVENIFNVTVLSVNTVKNAPEVKTNYRHRTYFKKGGIKKAIVKLKKGEKIELFDLEEEK